MNARATTSLLQRWLGVLVVLAAVCPAGHAILPESGIYVPGRLDPGDPSVVASLEVQGDRVHFSIVTFDSVTGLPVFYMSEGRLRDDAVNPGQSHAPGITTGYYPLHAYVGDLLRIEGGNCITCSTYPREWRRTNVGRIQLFFPVAYGVLADIYLDPQHVPVNGFRSEFLFLRRRPFGRATVQTSHPNPMGPPSLVHHDIRGQWVFVDQADAGTPVRDELLRYEFTEQELSPQPFVGPGYTVIYRDPLRGAEFRCTSIGTAIGQKAAGCELHSEGRVLFSARQNDIGMDRIQAFRGELPTIVALVPTITDPYRKAGQVIGLRVSMPPPGPLGPEGVQDVAKSRGASLDVPGPEGTLPSPPAPSGGLAPVER